MTHKEQIREALEEAGRKEYNGFEPDNQSAHYEQLRRAVTLLDTCAIIPVGKFQMGDIVRKKGDKGQWHGRVCGLYSTRITPNGYAVESIYEAGSVQIYPESALEPYTPDRVIIPRDVLEGMKKDVSNMESNSREELMCWSHNALIGKLLGEYGG